MSTVFTEIVPAETACSVLCEWPSRWYWLIVENDQLALVWTRAVRRWDHRTSEAKEHTVPVLVGLTYHVPGLLELLCAVAVAYAVVY